MVVTTDPVFKKTKQSAQDIYDLGVSLDLLEGVKHKPMYVDYRSQYVSSTLYELDSLLKKSDSFGSQGYVLLVIS